jgi:hypothetical protein
LWGGGVALFGAPGARARATRDRMKLDALRKRLRTGRNGRPEVAQNKPNARPPGIINKRNGPGDTCTLCKQEIPADDEQHFFTGFTICAKCARDELGAS